MGIKQIISKAREFGRKEIKLPRPISAVVRALQPRNIGRTAVILGGLGMGATASAGRKVAVKSGGIVQSTKNIISRATTNPFAGMGAKQVFTSIPKKAGALYAGATGFELIRTAQTGEKFKPLGLRTIQTALGFGLANPLIGGLGLATGIGQRGLETVKQNIPEIPQIPSVQMPNINLEVPNYQIPEIPSIPSFGGVSASYSPSTSFSAGVGMPSGGGYMDAMLLALLGGGLLGYGVAKRRKRKKKKYKKGRKQ